MPYHVAHKAFSGPLELLLELIEREEKEITDIALASVTEDFLAYVEREQGIKPEELADFLVVAARLLLLKSQALLPQEALEEDEGVPLEDQLRLYKEFVEAARCIDEQWKKNLCAYGRVVRLEVKPGFYPPDGVSASLLAGFLKELFERLDYFKRLPERALERVVSIKEKINSIRQLLQKQGKSSLRAVLGGTHEKSDIIVTFLALLELVKQKEVSLRQSNLFSDIDIEG